MFNWCPIHPPIRTSGIYPACILYGPVCHPGTMPCCRRDELWLCQSVVSGPFALARNAARFARRCRPRFVYAFFLCLEVQIVRMEQPSLFKALKIRDRAPSLIERDQAILSQVHDAAIDVNG